MSKQQNEFEDVDEDMDLAEYDGSESEALFWSMKLEPNQEHMIDQPPIEGYIVHITHACFGEQVQKGSRSVVMVNHSADPEDKSNEIPLCVLKAGNHENQTLDLLFNEAATLSVKGTKPSSVYLTGYIQPPVDDEGMDPAQMEDIDNEELEKMLRAQQMALDDEDDEEAPQLADEDDIDDEEEEEDESMNTSPPPQKKQKTATGSKTTKQTDSSTQKRKSPKQKPVKAPKTTTNGNQTKKVEEEKKVAVAAQDDDDKKEEEKKQQKKQKKDKKKSKKMQNMKGGIKYRDMKVGGGNAIKHGQKVSVLYVGQLDSKKVFDKHIKSPGFSFKFGAGEVIKGWDMGLKGMKVGGKRKIIIPAKLAYGADGQPPQIPPNSQLTFTIEVKKVE